MNYKQTTQVPNHLFDTHLNQLSHSELKILLMVIRQTYGWKLKNGKRKTRDRISHSQFITKTGVSRRNLSPIIQSLILKQLITVTDYLGNLLHTPGKRKGKVCIYYAPCSTTYAVPSKNVCTLKHKAVQSGQHNKTNYSKLKRTKGLVRLSDRKRIQEILRSKMIDT